MKDKIIKTRAEILSGLTKCRDRMKKREALQQSDREFEADLMAILRQMSLTGAE